MNKQFSTFPLYFWFFYPFRNGSIGAYGPVAEGTKVHCFFSKIIGTVPVFVGSVPFFLCRVNAPVNALHGPVETPVFLYKSYGSVPLF